MHDAVREQIRGFLQENEGSIRWMYLDILGKVTTGVGFLIDSAKDAQALLFTQGDDGDRASAADIAAEWQKVKADQAGAKAGHRYFKDRTRLRLSEEDIDELFSTKVDTFEAALKKNAAFAAFDEWPADAQLGLLGMAWALGTGFAAKFPAFAAACARRDFDKAAAESHISNGTPKRNAAHEKLFRNAAKVIASGADATQVYYPDEVPAGEGDQKIGEGTETGGETTDQDGQA